MADLRQSTDKIIHLMARYDPEHDITPGQPVVTFSDMSILEVLVDVLTIIDELQQKIAILRAAQSLRTEINNAHD